MGGATGLLRSLNRAQGMARMPSEDYDSQFKEYLWLLWVRKGSVLVVAAMVAGAALIYASRQPKTYSSVAEVLVNPVTTDPFKQVGLGEYIVLDPQRALATSVDVEHLAARRLGGALLPAVVSVTAPERTSTLVFKAVSRLPTAAQRTAQAYADAYLEFRQQDLAANVESISAGLEQRIEEIGVQISEVQSSLAAAESEPQRTAIELRRRSLADQRDSLEERRTQLVLPDNIRVGRILHPASHAVSGGSSRSKTLAFALFIGLALGSAQAILRARFDQRLRGRTDLATGAQAPVLALIPEVPSTRSRRLLTVMSSGSPDAEAYRALRETLLFAVNEHGIRCLMVTGANPGEGKTSTTANLGVALAQGGKRVILVSADLHHPQLQAYFPTDTEFGLTSVLNGERSALETLSATPVSGLRVLHSGPLGLASRDLLSSPAMRRTLSELEQEADIVLIDTAPVLTAADTMSLAPLVGAVLLVAAADRTTLVALGEARLRLEQVGAYVVGAVLNNVDLGRARFDQGYVRQNGTPSSNGVGVSSGDDGWSA